MQHCLKELRFFEEADETGPEESKWIKIRYDYMPKYCKTCKKQGHKEEECWVVHPELHKSFDGDVKDQGKEREVLVSTDVVGTAANKSKVLSSGKVVGKPTTNQAKQEWMQARKNKYQRDKRGHIIEDKTGKEVDKGKGKTKTEEVATMNKFNALEVEEVQNPPLQITEGKGEDHSNGKKMEQFERQSKEVQEKAKEFKERNPNPNPNSTGNRTTEQELIRVKKEAVEDALEKAGNPSPSGILSSSPKGVHELVDSTRINKESTIDWVHRRFGTSKEELRQLSLQIILAKIFHHKHMVILGNKRNVMRLTLQRYHREKRLRLWMIKRV